jgi:hypothetical protein
MDHTRAPKASSQPSASAARNAPSGWPRPRTHGTLYRRRSSASPDPAAAVRRRSHRQQRRALRTRSAAPCPPGRAGHSFPFARRQEHRPRSPKDRGRHRVPDQQPRVRGHHRPSNGSGRRWSTPRRRDPSFGSPARCVITEPSTGEKVPAKRKSLQNRGESRIPRIKQPRHPTHAGSRQMQACSTRLTI